MKHLCNGPIALEALLACDDPACGAALLFTGCVREHNEGRAVSGMLYTAHERLADKALADICSEALQQFEIRSCRIIHRLGELRLGDISVAIAVQSAHRPAAYEASRWAIEAIKQRVPIWKKEHYIDGASRHLDGHTLDAAL